MSGLTDARQWGENRHQDASIEKHAAFANSVVYAMTRGSGGFGGPSVREHAASRVVNESPKMFLDFDEACVLVENIVYGPLTDIHRDIWDHMQSICFDNDPQDEHDLRLYRAN